MLRSDVEAHPLWVLLDEIDGLLNTLTQDPFPEEIAPAGLLRAYVSNVRSMRDMALENPFQMSPAMLELVRQPMDDVRANLNARIATGANIAYFQNAVTAAENALMPLGSWPRPFAQGGQVRQMRTLIEDLLEQQRLGIEEIRRAHDQLLDQAAGVLRQAGERKAGILTELESLRDDAAEVAASVSAQKVRIDEVVDAGLASVDTIRRADAETLTTFRGEEAERLEQSVQPIRTRLENELKATLGVIETFRKQHQEFENMSSAAASKTMADKYRREALIGRCAGVAFYLLGFGAIVIAAVPFFSLLSDAHLDSAGIDWGRIVVRLALGALLGSAAAVVIRLGGRFLTQAAAAKRMELEFRTFEPFLANVEQRDAVDKARLDIVDRSFGRAYEASVSSPKGEKEDVTVDLSMVTKVVEAVVRNLPRN